MPGVISNIYKKSPTMVENIHDGEGVVKVANVFDNFATNMQFFHYTVVPPGASIGNHTHGNDEEYYCILDGKGEMTLDGETYNVCAGDIIRNEPFGEHGLRNTSQEDLRILVFEVKNI